MGRNQPIFICHLCSNEKKISKKIKKKLLKYSLKSKMKNIIELELTC